MIASFSLYAEVSQKPALEFCIPWYYIESFGSVFICSVAQSELVPLKYLLSR